jgi:hypothetical protein
LNKSISHSQTLHWLILRWLILQRLAWRRRIPDRLTLELRRRRNGDRRSQRGAET